FIEDLRNMIRSAHVAALIFGKAGWGLAGGVLLLLTIFGQRIFPVAGSTAASIGVLYGARGVGAGLGPIALRWILGQSPRTLRRVIGPAYFVVAVFYVALSAAPTLSVAALSVLCAHVGGSILWVFSTVLLQMEVPDRFRGCPGKRSERQYTPCWPTSASASVSRSSATARRPRALPIIVS